MMNGVHFVMIPCCKEFGKHCEADAVGFAIRRDLDNAGMTFNVLFFPGKFD